MLGYRMGKLSPNLSKLSLCAIQCVLQFSLFPLCSAERRARNTKDKQKRTTSILKSKKYEEGIIVIIGIILV